MGLLDYILQELGHNGTNIIHLDPIHAFKVSWNFKASNCLKKHDEKFADFHGQKLEWMLHFSQVKEYWVLDQAI